MFPGSLLVYNCMNWFFFPPCFLQRLFLDLNSSLQIQPLVWFVGSNLCQSKITSECARNTHKKALQSLLSHHSMKYLGMNPYSWQCDYLLSSLWYPAVPWSIFCCSHNKDRKIRYSMWDGYWWLMIIVSRKMDWYLEFQPAQHLTFFRNVPILIFLLMWTPIKNGA